MEQSTIDLIYLIFFIFILEYLYFYFFYRLSPFELVIVSRYMKYQLVDDWLKAHDLNDVSSAPHRAPFGLSFV